MIRNLTFLVLTIFLASCGASIDPLLQSKVNGYFTKSSSDVFPPGGKFQRPMPFAVGQYVIHATTYDGKRSISKMAIVGKEDGGWIIESYSLTESNEAISQMLIKGLDKFSETYNSDDIDILWVKTKEKDKPVEKVEGPVLSIMKGFYKKALVNFNMKLTQLSDGIETVVPAGTFKKTTMASSEIQMFGSTYTSEGWFHPEVPINGLVKSVSKENNSTMELVEFGNTGARPSF